MEGISGVSGVLQGATAPTMSPAGLAPLAGGDSAGAMAGASVVSTQSMESVSSTSMSASIESFMAVTGAAAGNNELLGAVLLLLILEYLRSEDGSQRQDLLSLIGALAGQQGQSSGGAGVFLYSASALTVESTQIMAASSQVVTEAYSGTSSTLQQAPAADPGSAGLNVIA